jgi:PAS domain S-box-containing protein
LSLERNSGGMLMYLRSETSLELLMAPVGQNLEEQYQTILDSITDGVYAVNNNWRITYFNRAAEKIIGISRQEAIGKSCFEVFRSNVCEDTCIVRETLSTKKPVANQPIYIIRANKKRIPISATTSILKDVQGRVIGGVVAFKDLTALSQLKKELFKHHSFEDIVSKNAQMHRIFSILPQVAESKSTVLIEGASGTGKELIAQAIHNNSFNKKGPFIAINCGALPDALVESELFGYRAGAFTDAKRDKPGRFAQAMNGTLLLDEIGDISSAMQVKLLRVLENRVYEPLGATESVRTNARIIVATNQPLARLVRKGKFREDLYYRINVVKFSLPDLVERKEDIPLLTEHFIEKYNRLTAKSIVGISQRALAVLMLHDWPGNVRELENAIEHAFVLCRNDIIRIDCLPDHIFPTGVAGPIPVGLTLREIEKRSIEMALERNQWKKMVTAKELGINKNSLRRKIIRLDIQPPAALNKK